MLNEVPAYPAAQLHHKIRALDSQVSEVDFAAFKVTNPQKIAQLLRALKQVKPIALGVYRDTRDTFGLSLRLRQCGSEEVVLKLFS